MPVEADPRAKESRHTRLDACRPPTRMAPDPDVRDDGTRPLGHHVCVTMKAAQAAAFYSELPKDMPSVAVTKSEHQVFTNAWRKAIPYGANGTGMATGAQIDGAAGQIYAGYPNLLSALGLG